MPGASTSKICFSLLRECGNAPMIGRIRQNLIVALEDGDNVALEERRRDVASEQGGIE
jgi:hypothetical protein